MARYIPRTCPKCRDYFGVVVIHPHPEAKTLPVEGYCATCQYRIKWSLVVGSVKHHSLPTLRRRLVQSGLRLARLLNETLK
jgi:hypothetical protein